jgi:hypothetical protein
MFLQVAAAPLRSSRQPTPRCAVSPRHRNCSTPLPRASREARSSNRFVNENAAAPRWHNYGAPSVLQLKHTSPFGSPRSRPGGGERQPLVPEVLSSALPPEQEVEHESVQDDGHERRAEDSAIRPEEVKDGDDEPER